MDLMGSEEDDQENRCKYIPEKSEHRCLRHLFELLHLNFSQATIDPRFKSKAATEHTDVTQEWQMGFPASSMYVWAHIQHVPSKDQPDKVANPIRGQLNRENVSPSRFALENLVSRDGFGSPVPRQLARLHSQAESGAYLRDSSHSAVAPIYSFNLNRHTPSGQSRVHRVTQ